MSASPILKKIPTMGKRQLENLCINAQRVVVKGSDPAKVAEAREVLAGCERELRKFQPKAAFGRRAEEAMEELAARHGLLKLRNNQGKDGVLPGGGMFANWFVAEYYVGFKCPPFRRQAALSAVIMDKESDIEFWVYDLDHAKVENGDTLPDWLPAHWDLGIPMLRTKDPDEAADAFRHIIEPYTDLNDSQAA